MPAVVVPAAIAAGVIIAPLAAGAADLPSKTPDEVLQLVAASDVKAFSGTIEQSSDLGLPSIPSTGPGSGAGSGSSAQSDAASILGLLTGDHTAKVYADGPTKQRLQVLDQLAERDVIRNGSDVWLYTSTGTKVTHVTVPDRSAVDSSVKSPDHRQPDPDATTGAATTPAQLAQRFLTAVDSSTAVTLGAPQKVAGRDAYDLVLTPKSTATLVGSVSIAVDGTTGIPLQVQVDARGQSTPAFQVGFSDFSTATPSASVFAFTPPKGATVTEQSPSASGEKKAGSGTHPKPTVTGSGWDAIVSLPAGAVPSDLTSSPLFSQLTTAVSGGHAFSTTLVSVLLTDDGRVFAGAVPVSALQAAALQSAGQ